MSSYKASEVFWQPKKFANAQRVRCALHDEWVSTEWALKNEGTPSQAYDVLCKPSKYACRSHFGATDIITIGKPAWEAANENHVWMCFVPEDEQ